MSSSGREVCAVWSRWSFLAALVATVLVVVCSTLWPGDVQWVNDEPRLVANAWHASRAGHPAWGGLWGNFGLRYGPLPTQCYQVLLAITHDPIVLAVLRAGLCAAFTGGSLLWLARSAGWTPWLVPAVLAAPRVLNYHRVLWDASFAMPLGTLALAAFAGFLRNGAPRSLVLSLTAAAFLPTVHPQGLPLALAIGGFLAWKQRRAIRHGRGALLIALAVFLTLNGAYFVEVAHFVLSRLGGAVSVGYPGGMRPSLAALAPFLGGNLLAGLPDSFRSAAASFNAWMRGVSLLIYPLCWAGFALAAGRAWRLSSKRREESPDARDCVRDAVAVVALSAVLMQGVLFAVMRVPSEEQYFFGTFAAHVSLGWLALEALRAVVLRTAVLAAWGIATAWLGLYSIVFVHLHGLPGDSPRPSLAAQVEAARSLGEYVAPKVFTDVAQLQRYPQGIRTLRLLTPLPERKTGARLLVTHRVEPDGRPGALEVRELAGTDPLPPSATPFDITPLPAGWFPDPAR